MKFTPLDIRQKRFESALRGFARNEVQGFLELLASEFEEVVKDNIALKEELKRTHLRLEQHIDRERTLQQTLVTAQRVSDELKNAAKKEAEIVIAQAEHQAEKIVHAAHLKLVSVVDDINELKRQRTQFEAQLHAVIHAHGKMLEAFAGSSFADQDFARVEDNIAFLAQKKKAGSADG